ncbi:MAG TPA: 1-(5-phosphoribosyl)-5-[(5-phosphoribosylamino)methylideneamino] imidazole-4-carboxamide isomerase [Acidimicrobiales bacterium]|nr:1-(5-phosphoribosyl)-5-[(5-phosphoribosylamino)methylideneamino] imidazole-4-carboxamide isomerase [Acidimicrobiales bacterium]
MDLFPAVDLKGGAAVRLVQGDFARSHDYGDPVALARRYADGGASWIHVVDLDAARHGDPRNRHLVLDILSAVAVPVQVGGGVRTVADADALLGAGAARVVVGTAAVTDPPLLATMAARHPGRIAVGLDHRGHGAEVSVAGWEEGGGMSLDEALGRLEEVDLAAVVVTAIERDGMLQGPDRKGLAHVLGGTRHPVVASGGVRHAEDLRVLGALRVGGRGLAGVVVGKALVDGVLGIEEALRACTASG